MHPTKLRKIGGSVMPAMPPALLDMLRLGPGGQVGIAIESGRLIVELQRRPRYCLDELLAQCNPEQPRSDEERGWLSDGPAGGEIL